MGLLPRALQEHCYCQFRPHHPRLGLDAPGWRVSATQGVLLGRTSLGRSDSSPRCRYWWTQWTPLQTLPGSIYRLPTLASPALYSRSGSTYSARPPVLDISSPLWRKNHREIPPGPARTLCGGSQEYPPAACTLTMGGGSWPPRPYHLRTPIPHQLPDDRRDPHAGPGDQQHGV